MPATTKNLTGDDRLESGATFERKFKLTKDTEDTAWNLTDHTFAAKFRSKEYGSDTMVATFAVTNPSGGEVVMKLADDVTLAWQALAVAKQKDGMSGVWDMESVAGGLCVAPFVSGQTYRWLEGTWTMTNSTTY
jgi:hypothetical protein